MREADAPDATCIPASTGARDGQNAPLAGAATGTRPGILDAAWGRSVQWWLQTEPLLGRWADQIATRFLETTVRLRLVASSTAEPLGSEADATPSLAYTADQLDRTLRLLVAAVYVGLLPLFALTRAATSFTRCADCWFNHLTNLYLLIPIVGALCGLTRLRLRPVRFDPDVERAMLAFVGGLCTSALGGIVWWIYTALGRKLPYPSLADVGYLAALLVWMVAIFFVYRSRQATLVGEVGPLAPLGSATMFVVVTVVLFTTRDLQLPTTAPTVAIDPGKTALDIAYPMLGIYNCVFIAALLAGRVFEELNGDMKKAVLCLTLGMLLNVLADTAFAISTTLALKAPGVAPTALIGDAEDWLYATGPALVSLGVLFLNSDPAERAARAAEPQ